jgi:hypothetical protein
MTFTCPISTGERILIEKKEPTTDDSSWYNLYSDGWLEQGGTATSDIIVEFLKPFRDAQYVITLGKIIGGSDGIPRISAKTTNNFRYSSSNVANTHSDWQASGYAEIQTPTNFYFKVANAVQNLELLNVGEVMEAVNNVVPNNKSLISGYCIPDYTAGITIPFPTGSSWFTTPTDGIAVLYVPEIEAKVNILYINGQQTSFRINGTQTYKDLSSLIVPLSKNTTIAFDTNSAGGSYSGTFYPYKGAI